MSEQPPSSPEQQDPRDAYIAMGIRLGIEYADAAPGRIVEDRTAMLLAWKYHGGPVSSMYRLAANGRVDRNVMAELQDRYSFASDAELNELGHLGDYVAENLGRPPVPDWENPYLD